MESMEHGGQWWLPQSPEVTVPGVLRVDDKGRSQLTLIGELRSELTESERHDRPVGGKGGKEGGKVGAVGRLEQGLRWAPRLEPHQGCQRRGLGDPAARAIGRCGLRERLVSG